MTPRPEIFAVPGTLNLHEFTAQINEHAFSRVPVYTGSLDEVTGIAFAHDLLKILDAEAGTRTVAQIQRPVAFVPETKKVAELLREMQREKQHMRIVIDEYGGVAGLVTIEDLLEAIVGSISDEHDEPEADDAPIREPNGAYVVSGSFELSRLRDLFADQFEPHRNGSRTVEAIEDSEESEDSKESEDTAANQNIEANNLDAGDRPRDSHASESLPTRRAHSEAREDYELRDTRDDPTALRLPEHYESTTLGGLVSEITGHIPLPGEVVEEDGLRLEILASTDRRIDRIRISLTHPPRPA
jgi:putative hemolysin